MDSTPAAPVRTSLLEVFGERDWVFGEDESAEELDDLARAAWTFGPAGGPAAVRGTDIALVDGGLIRRLSTFVEPVTP